jgi:T-complex protein 1 subunit theta
MPRNPAAFNADNIRVVKVMGGGLEDSKVVRGMVFSREPSGIHFSNLSYSGVIKKTSKAKVGVFSCPIDISKRKQKGRFSCTTRKKCSTFPKAKKFNLKKCPLILSVNAHLDYQRNC